MFLPPLPLPLLPQPDNKLSEIRDLFNFLLSQHPKPRTPALLVHSLVCPIPSPPHRTHPGPASPGEQVAAGPAAFGAPGGGTFRECSALPAEWMFYWETDGRLLYLSSFFPIISCLPFLLSFPIFPLLPLSSLSFLLFLSPFVLSALYLFLLSFLSLSFPFSLLRFTLFLTKAQQLPAFLWGKCKYPSTNST